MKQRPARASSDPRPVAGAGAKGPGSRHHPSASGADGTLVRPARPGGFPRKTRA